MDNIVIFKTMPIDQEITLSRNYTIGIIYDFDIAYSFNVSSFIYTSLHVIIQNT